MQIATLCRSLTLCLIFIKVHGTLVRIATQSLCERDHSFPSLRLLVAEYFPTNIARIAKASLHSLWSIRHQFVTQLDDISPLQWDVCIDQLEIILRTNLRYGWEVNGIEPNLKILYNLHLRQENLRKNFFLFVLSVKEGYI